MMNNEGSFRDHSGQIISRDNKIYRCILGAGTHDFETVLQSKGHELLIEKKMLIPHQQLDFPAWAPEDTSYFLEHPRLPMISYPWEWCFSMLKDAALLHLDIMESLLPEGLWLRDASAFNVQFDGQRLLLIDTLSVGKRIPDSPWVAYKQFCSHFLAPLAMAAYSDIRTLGLWRNYIDGFPLDMAVNLLPFGKRYVPGILMHLTLHSKFQEKADRKENIQKNNSVKKAKLSDTGLLGIVKSLRNSIRKISWNPSSKIWLEYESLRTYKDEDVTIKSAFIEKFIQHHDPKRVWDLGANIGEFSIIAASKGAFVVSIEGDPACTEFLYQHLSQNPRNHRILPLTMDLCNPSPGLGWDSRERKSLGSRGPADLLMALALIHHLVFKGCIPLHMIAEWFASLAEYVIVEFIPPTDPMVQKLLGNRGSDHLPYNQEIFLNSFSSYFDFEEQKTLPNGRTLFVCSKRKSS